MPAGRQTAATRVARGRLPVGNAKATLEPALDAGVSLELLQAYFLIHDDWMDQDSVRRGGPSVHALLAKRLRSRTLGHASAILAGDYAVALASETLLKVNAPPARLVQCAEQFAKMQSDAVVGQQLDIVGKSNDIEAAYALKTGSYTVRGPLLIGGILGGGSPRTLQALERFAVPVGVAFQLRDDLLSAFGDPDKTGKPFGNDLKQGKRTVLLQAALRRAKGRDHRTLKQVVGNRKATVPQLRRAVDVLERSGAKAVVEARIAELVADGRSALQSKTLTPSGRELLEGAIAALAERRS